MNLEACQIVDCWIHHCKSVHKLVRLRNTVCKEEKIYYNAH